MSSSFYLKFKFKLKFSLKLHDQTKEQKTKLEAEKTKLEGLLQEKDGALKAITDKEMRSEEYSVCEPTQV